VLPAAVSFSRDVVMTRGAEAGRLLGTGLCEEQSGDLAADGDWGLLRAPKGPEGVGRGREQGSAP